MIKKEQKIAAREPESDLSSTDGPHAFPPVGQWVREEWRVAAVVGASGGGRRRGCGRAPLSRGERGRGGRQRWRGRQGLPRPSGPFAGAKNRRGDASEVSRLVRHRLFQPRWAEFGPRERQRREEEKLTSPWMLAPPLLGPVAPLIVQPSWGTRAQRRFLDARRIWQAGRRQGLEESCVTAPKCVPSPSSVSVPLPLSL